MTIFIDEGLMEIRMPGEWVSPVGAVFGGGDSGKKVRFLCGGLIYLGLFWYVHAA